MNYPKEDSPLITPSGSDKLKKSASGTEKKRPRIVAQSEDDDSTKGKFVVFGTTQGAWIWLNSTDMIGIIFAAIVWAAVGYAVAVWVVLYTSGDLTFGYFFPMCIFVPLALWCHLAVMMGDPGSVPWNAHPIEMDKKSGQKLQICGHCDSYKPPLAHHDRVSGRCISRMDHFCPWMNNAIGAGNQKNFILFLVYTNITSLFMYVVVATNMIEDTAGEGFSGTGLEMSRGLIFVLLFSILFTTSMIANQVYGIVCGLGTIDRMKLKGDEVGNGVTIPWKHVFGDDWGVACFLPVDAYISRLDKVFRYKTKSYAYGRSV
jgi:hypothetical protein